MEKQDLEIMGGNSEVVEYVRIKRGNPVREERNNYEFETMICRGCV